MGGANWEEELQEVGQLAPPLGGGAQADWVEAGPSGAGPARGRGCGKLASRPHPPIWPVCSLQWMS